MDARGRQSTTRWSEGFPFFVFGLTGGFVTGSLYHFPRVDTMGSRILSGFSLVGTFTCCCRFGDKFVIGFRLSLFVSPAIMKCIEDPYLAERK